MRIVKACLLSPVLLFMAMSAAQAGLILNLAPPNLNPFTGVDVGNTQIGAEIKALSTFTIDSAGIFFNPFGNITPQPDTYELDAYIYQIDGFGTTGYENEGTRGNLLSSASYCIGVCPDHTLFPANPEDGALNWFDVPIDFTFEAGEEYLVEFDVLPDGWGSGLTAKNNVQFYAFDPDFVNDPPNRTNTPFTVGPVQVIDGAFGSDLAVHNLPNLRLDDPPVPEPATGVLLGASLLLGVVVARRFAIR